MSSKKKTSKSVSTSTRPATELQPLANLNEHDLDLGTAVESAPDAPRFARHLVWFLEFVNPSISDYELNRHKVLEKLNRAVNVTVRRFRCPESRFDLFNDAYLQFRHRSHYSGAGSIDGYLLKMLRNMALLMKQTQVPGKFKYVKLDEDHPSGVAQQPWVLESLDDYSGSGPLELSDPDSLNLQYAVLKNLQKEECMAKLLKKAENSALHRVAVEMICRCVKSALGEEEDDYYITAERLTDRRLAEKASEVLGKHVSRYKASLVLDELKPILNEWLRP